ncbi:MAG: ATP-binding cassette domain-containing protein [Lachnospiraceae bacterium]|nr:ATP-binding cassette domain-containing protein [Lachnospiraceae bacterium]
MDIREIASNNTACQSYSETVLDSDTADFVMVFVLDMHYSLIDGNNIFEFEDEELTVFRRRKIGFVFQAFNLIPVLTVYENIVLPIELDGNTPDRKFVDGLIETLGLTEKRNAYPNQLSGGQQQRVAIARALASTPQVVLADEPTGNLDSKTGLDVLGLLKVLGAKYAQTIVMITHNDALAQMADRIVRIEDGLIVSKEV